MLLTTPSLKDNDHNDNNDNDNDYNNGIRMKSDILLVLGIITVMHVINNS